MRYLKFGFVLQICVLFSCSMWITIGKESPPLKMKASRRELSVVKRRKMENSHTWYQTGNINNDINTSIHYVHKAASELKWPVTTVALKNSRTGKLLCGGSLVNSQFVISAAHCVKGVYPGFIVALVGTQKLSDHYSGIVRDVVQVWINGGFNFDTFDWDVAVLKLRAPVPLGNDVVPICLAANENFRYNRNQVMAVGWGRQKESNPISSDVLRKVNVPIINSRVCQRSYRRFRVITDRMICAGVRRGGRDSCQGDSGGPLVVRSGRNLSKYVQLGIVSWGNGCGRPNFYGVYTKMSKVISWIKKYTSVQQC